MKTHIVEITNVTRRFAGTDEPAIDNVSAKIPKGKITGLIGPDGAGKTTLIRLITGLLLPTSGEIKVNADYIGYMPQQFGLYEDLTVMQNLDLYADLHGVTGKQRKETVERLLHFTSLEPFTKRLAGKLSGGMKQKLGIACSLISRPQLLLLDEPGVGVDPISRRELWDMVNELSKGDITVLWSTSYLNEAEKCDNILLLNKGKLLFEGKPADFTGEGGSFEDKFISVLGGEPEQDSRLADMISRVEKGDEAVIEAKNLTKMYGKFAAAKNINFSVKPGEIFGLLGPNGAGKSTIFRMMCGLLRPTSGQAMVTGLNLETASGKARANIGYMAQKFSLYRDLSVLQNMKFFSGAYGLKGREQKERIDKIIDIFDFRHYLYMNAGELPLGYKQRLALACAVMHEPAVLFLDEPTSGVDPIMRREFWMHIKGMVKKGVTIMVTTHFMEEAENCNRISLIYKAQSIAIGTPQELKNMVKTEELPNPTMEDTFIELVKRNEKTDTAD